MHRETRVFSFDRGEIRADGDAVGRKFSGHAAVFNRLSTRLWGFYERILESAFDNALEGKDDVRFLINHDPSLLLARTKSGTLDLSKDKEGLVAEAELPDTSYARDLGESMDREDIDQMSFGFRTVRDSWDEEELDTDEGPITVTVRTLEEVELFDVSVVTFPAYPDTDAELNAAAYRYLGLAPVWRPQPPLLRSGTEGTGAGDAQTVTVHFNADTTEFEQALARVQAGLTELRVGKVLSAKHKDALKDASELIAGVLAAAEPTGDDGEENQLPSPALAIARRRLALLEREVALP